MSLLWIVAAVLAVPLFVGLRWGVTAVHSGTVERSRNPGLFWATMALLAASIVAMVFGAVFGR